MTWPPEGTPSPADRTLGLLDFLRVDEESDALLVGFAEALAATKERAALVAYGDESAGIAPWQVLTDPAVAPLWALPFAAQFTGGTIPPRIPGESDVDFLSRARAEVVRPRGMIRGSPSAYRLALEPFLTDTKYVRVITRYEDSAWKLLVLVLESELLDEDGLRERANADDVIGAGMRAIVVPLNGEVWDSIDGTWDSLAPGTTWDGV